MEKKIYKITRLSPYISSGNTGDKIIAESCRKYLEEIFGECFEVDIPTRDRLSQVSRFHIATADYSVVCGTNLLSSDIKAWSQWIADRAEARRIVNAGIRKRDYLDYRAVIEKREQNRPILLGVGWWQYQDRPTAYTQRVFRRLLSRTGLHSVRDSYTMQMLKNCGIENVVNTGCPTMWGLTPEFCRDIPVKKADRVITTLTDYMRDREQDELLFSILTEHYSEVCVWLQALEDYEYLLSLKNGSRVTVIAPTLSAYDQCLESGEIDYVGTRLHGGIRALNHKKRSMILSVDNRAAEIAKDTGLPVIRREELGEKLEAWIYGGKRTQILLPQADIDRWKAQFGKGR